MGSKDVRFTVMAIILGIALGVVGFIGIRSFGSSPDAPSGGGSTTPQQQEQGSGTPAATPSTHDEAVRIVSEMTLEEKVAQLFIVYPEQITGVSVQTLAGEATLAALTENPVGGIVFFAQNLQGPDQTRAMLSNMQSYSHDVTGLPLFLCVDEEGGSVVRIADNPEFGVEDVGNAADIGAIGNSANANAAGSYVGAYLADLGFNVDFAPVADVANNPEATAMTLRSYGSDASLAADMVADFIGGMLPEGVYPCAKHFPGIGGSVGDSETGAITSSKTVDEMASEELRPFQAAIDAGVPFVMVGHLTCTGVSDSGLPASLDPEVVSILRNRLGFQGIIVTDALSMGAVVDLYPASEIGVVALLAGDDMILMPQDYEACYQGVLDAVEDGRLTEDRIDESVTRIVEAKLALEG